MNREAFQRAEELFHDAVEVAADERMRFLDDRCDDPAIRAMVEELLELDGSAIGAVTLGERLTDPGVEDGPDDPGPGDRIGHFRLDERIGDGGMGVVFRASQLEPVARRVALKLIKRGMDTDEVIARFDAERQALAVMNHPHIARVYEAGATRSGRPYFSMEYIEGAPVTRYCDEARLTTRARLELFLKICDAVQHAHRRGVIHRDLKPSNILVATEEGEPGPKVIDFGIAKAIESDPAAHRARTEFGQLLGTLEYMSPEQAVGAHDEVDTRTDVYALGVVLYEMLVGVLPFAIGEATTGTDEIRRRICQEAPSRPSGRLVSPGPESTESAARRRTDVRTLRRLLDGDLDWITMKALAKEPDRRYQSAAEFADDVRRYLRHEPVLAGPPDLSYRARRFVRRHRTLVAASSAVALALVAGIVVAGWFAVGQSRARVEAERQTDLANAILAFLQEDLLGAANPEVIPDRDLTVREALDIAARKIEERFPDEPIMSGSTHSMIGLTYSALGEAGRAEHHLRAAIEDYTADPGPDSYEMGAALGNLGEMMRRQGRLREAEPLLVRALEIKRRHLPESDPSLGLSINNLGLMYRDLGRLDEAVPALEESLELARRHEGVESLPALITVHNLALAFGGQGRHPEAIDMLSTNLEAWKRVVGDEHPYTFATKHVLAVELGHANRLDEAVALFREVVERRRTLLGERHPDTLISMGGLARGLFRQGRLDEAAGLFEATIDAMDEVMPDHWMRWSIRTQQGECLTGKGEFAQAESILLASHERLEERFDADDRRVHASADALVALYEAWGRGDEAAAWAARTAAPRATDP